MLCQCQTERNSTSFFQLPPRHKFLAGKQPLFPAGPFPGAKHQQYPGGAQKVEPAPHKPKQTAADVAPAMCEPNLSPCHDSQEKGPDRVSGAMLEGPGEGRNCMFLNGQRWSFTNFDWHLLLCFPLLKTKPSHREVSGLFTLCQSGKHKS